MNVRPYGNLPNPKLGGAGAASDQWYRYYAGYSADFVEASLKIVGRVDGPVLDPWNGTGTTTFVARKLGRDSIGCDVNPALGVIARARLLHPQITPSLDSLCEDIVAHSDEKIVKRDDPFEFWFDPAAAAHLRGLQRSIDRLLVSTHDATLPPIANTEAFGELASFFYVALFKTVRELVKPYGGSNPTWWKRLSDSDKVSASASSIDEIFRNMVRSLESGLVDTTSDRITHTSIVLGDSRCLSAENGSVSGIIASPPYCTRIDYGIATLPELLTLGADKSAIRRIRDSMVGTPTVTNETATREKWGSMANDFLDRVTSHASFSSANYYKKYFTQYYSGMWSSLGEASRVLRKGSPCILVVQDSYYKEVWNDVPSILVEMAEQHGMVLNDRVDFRVSRSKGRINSRSKPYRDSASATESVLILEKNT